ncbi:phenylalanine--tRNA ligase subunit alpha [Patescibacteria group bacterium]|nr:phenylalanine--tRNA ligase subunit alpha [Patescibacteria group bacterium]
MEENIERILDSLSPNERKIIPYLEEKDLIEICKRSNLEKVSVIRSLEYLDNKGIIKISIEKRKLIDLGINGILYKKKGLPERRLLNLLNEKRILNFSNVSKESGLSSEELKASIGVLKKRNLIDLKKGKIIFNANREEITKKTPEEHFLEILPINPDSLNQEQGVILESLKKRKEIIQITEEKKIGIEITDLGKKIIEEEVKGRDLIEQITPELLKKESFWKGKKFRRYNVSGPFPKIEGGKRHIVNQAIDYARRIWTEMGFKEMTGPMVLSSFWNFDVLFTAQDHPVREMQDTFFIEKKGEIPQKEIIQKIKESHEKGVGGSKGWGNKWSEEEAKKLVLRTHTTCLSAKTLSELDLESLPQKFFAIGKCFRNETIDWSHGFEFNQTEGIVIDKNANFRHLLGYLKEFFKKMGFEKVRFRPGYFPYTEPSLEIDVWHNEKKVWFELGGAGILRPEVVIPLLGKNIPVLAWGPGLDRMIMDYYEIKDFREIYKNNLSQLRKTKFWVRELK